MRPIDMEEAAIVTSVPVIVTLVWGVLFTEVVALRAGKTVLALYGVRDLNHLQEGLGYIWMLATHDAALPWNKHHVFSACQAYVEECARRFTVLGNAVYAKNHKALRFVARLGFQAQPAIMVHGAWFHPIARVSCAE